MLEKKTELNAVMVRAFNVTPWFYRITVNAVNNGDIALARATGEHKPIEEVARIVAKYWAGSGWRSKMSEEVRKVSTMTLELIEVHARNIDTWELELIPAEEWDPDYTTLDSLRERYGVEVQVDGNTVTVTERDEEGDVTLIEVWREYQPRSTWGYDSLELSEQAANPL